MSPWGPGDVRQSGASPAEHGIIGNSWFDRDAGKEATSVADPSYPLVGTTVGVDKGRSPHNLLLPTIGDALIEASSGQAKVVAIATKDRSAILPAGFAGKAFFLESAGYVTTRYYGDALPSWVSAHNAAHPVEGFRGKTWDLTLPRDSYVRKADDDRAWEHPSGKLGRTFPHTIDGEGTLESVLSATPFADELAASLAESAIDGEALGADPVPDLLSLSLAATDAIGHAFGPESLEAEDNFVRLDRTLEHLFAVVDDRVGLEHTLVVLSADHGATESPEWLKAHRLPGERVLPSELLEAAKKSAKTHFGSDALVRTSTVPYLWLDLALCEKRSLDPLVVARAVASDVSREPHVYAAVPTRGPLPEGEVFERVAQSIHPRRSGEIYVVLRPYSLLLQHEGMATTHGSPWTYDTLVPLIVTGPGLPWGRVDSPVDPRSITPTVAALLGFRPPAGASRPPLKELLPKADAPSGSDTP